MLIDTHAHIHFDEFRDEALPDGQFGDALDEVLNAAHDAGVDKIICVGVNEVDSGQAIALAKAYEHIWATSGLHPHEADSGYEALEEVARLANLDKVVAIGECGLDYFKSETTKEDQERVLRFQIELGLELDLPMVFHVRDAFDDFFRLIDEYEGVRGVVHSFTAGTSELHGALERGFYIALNGIMTFTKDERQLEAAKIVPSDRLVIETDTPFLAPVPLRGRRNEPANLAVTAKFLAELRGEAYEDLADSTTTNAETLFGI
jgi:TatD DNase family protein